MTKGIFIFAGAFVLGAVIALIARAAQYSPKAAESTPAPVIAREYAPLVKNTLSPSKAETDPHAGHAMKSAPPAASAPSLKTPVNTVCAICGMKVDPSVPTLEYQGKTIGFGCKMCPPKFKADPERFGPYYLRNEVIKR